MRPLHLLAIAALAAGPALGACSFQGNGNPGDDQGDDVVADDTGDDTPPPTDAPVADAEGTPDAEPPPPDAFVPQPVTETFG